MNDERIAVIGLGYVGLPLAVAISKQAEVVGFDINGQRVEELGRGIDKTNEVASADLGRRSLVLTSDAGRLAGRTIYIVTVPTPINEANRPDFTAILRACELVGPVLSRGAIVVFESTVYPGVTEEICGPALEQASGLTCGTDFTLGYSPERINPGDREHPLEKIIKVVAGQDEATLDRLAAVYGSIIEAGIHTAPSIKVAEAAKVLENTQRDVNIALMNEVSKICDLVGIRSRDVLAAAATKWNFLNFHPGLVGGHCIGVDPYYLTAKAEELGYHPEVILSGRRINDGMGSYVAQRVVKLLAARNFPILGSRVGILGLTFKENVPDIRNSKVFGILNELGEYGVRPLVHDPRADGAAVRRIDRIEMSPLEEYKDLAALIYAVPHDAYRSLEGAAMSDMIAPNGILIDIKSRLEPQAIRPDVLHWSL